MRSLAKKAKVEKAKVMSGKTAEEIRQMNPKSYEHKMVNKTRVVLGKVFEGLPMLPSEQQITCMEDALFIITRVIQLQQVLRCDAVATMVRTGLYEYILDSIEETPTLDNMRKFMHYVLQTAADCLCHNPELLMGNLKTEHAAHIGYLVTAIQEAYPTLPRMVHNPAKNCQILASIRTMPYDKLKFCAAIEGSATAKEEGL